MENPTMDNPTMNKNFKFSILQPSGHRPDEPLPQLFQAGRKHGG